MKKIKETLGKISFNKILYIFQIGFYLLVIFTFVQPIVAHLITNDWQKHIEADEMRFVATIWVFIAFSNWKSADRYRKDNHRVTMQMLVSIRDKYEILAENRILVNIIEQIDKKTLEKFGIIIRIKKTKPN